MQPGEVLALIPYFINSFDLAYLTTKWYILWVFGILLFPIHAWIIRDTGWAHALSWADLPYFVIVIGFIVAAGFLSDFCVVRGFNISPVLPLIGFKDSFNTPSLALIHGIAQVVKLGWSALFILYFQKYPNFAITFSMIIWLAVVGYQYFATRYIINSLHAPHHCSPFASVMNVSDYHLTYVLVGLAAFLPLYFVNVVGAGPYQLPIVASISFAFMVVVAVIRTVPLLRKIYSSS